MSARLFVIPASHPSITAALMLERKRVPFKRIDLLPVVSKAVVRAAGFPRTTVPALWLDGARIQGSRAIARELELRVPEPPLFPSDPERRAAVEEAERFGDEELQQPIRTLLWWAFRRDSEPLRSYAAGARIGIPIDLAMRTAAPIVALAARLNRADDAGARAALAALPALLDRVDAHIAAGTIGGEEPTAADFQIATSIGLAMTMADLRPAIADRPAGALAARIVPAYPGHTPPVFPPAWLEPLQLAATG